MPGVAACDRLLNAADAADRASNQKQNFMQVAAVAMQALTQQQQIIAALLAEKKAGKP